VGRRSPPPADAARRGAAYYALLVLFASLAAGFGALAVWQVERRAWKHALIERVDARVRAPAEEAPGRSGWSQVDRVGDEYRHVAASGTWIGGRDTFVRAVTVFGAGFWTLTPLRRTDGSVILVNRGFVANDRRAEVAAKPLADGPVRIGGLLRLSEPGGGFLQRNDPAADRWFSRDVAAIATTRRLADVAPYFIDADADPDGPEAAAARGGPVAGLTVVAFTDNHLLYAAIWSILAAMSVAAVALLGRRTRSTGPPGDRPGAA
jgi:surfeit locus 1 family protein